MLFIYLNAFNALYATKLHQFKTGGKGSQWSELLCSLALLCNNFFIADIPRRGFASDEIKAYFSLCETWWSFKRQIVWSNLSQDQTEEERKTDMESHNPSSEHYPGYGAAAPAEPMYPPPPYMPPPYPTGPVMYPQPIPAQGGFIPPDLPPEEAGSKKEQDPNLPSLVTDPSYPSQEPEILVSEFEDKSIRKAFIRKVFSVVTLQLLVTFTVVCVFTFSSTVKTAVQKNFWIYLSSYITFVVVGSCIALFSSFSRTHPWNMIGLSLVTLSLSYMVGTVASYHDTTAVVIALGSTLVISFTIIIFSAQTRLDFTLCNGILLILSVNLLMFGFFTIFFYSNVVQIVYGCLGALLYAMFLAVDCQLVMGRQKYSLNPEEYIFAALIIYLDIIMIFLYILMILGGSSKN